MVVAPASPPLTNDCSRRRLRSPPFSICRDGYCCSNDVKMACDASLYQLRNTKLSAVFPPSMSIVGVLPLHSESMPSFWIMFRKICNGLVFALTEDDDEDAADDGRTLAVLFVDGIDPLN